MTKLESVDCRFPATIAEALAIMAGTPDAVYLAGGTDLLVQWQTGAVAPPPLVVSLSTVAELQDIHDEGASISVGSMVTHARLRDDVLVRTHVPALAEAAATVGAVQIQNRGTIGGSVVNASPAGDLAPALLVAGGSVVMAGADGERSVSLEKFFLGYRRVDMRPGEVLVRFSLPKLPAGHCTGFHKLGPRKAQAISKVMGAWQGAVADGSVATFRIAVGSVAPTAVRLGDLEAWLRGKPLDTATMQEADRRAAAEVNPIDDIRSTADYRRWATGRLVRSFLERLAAP